MQPEDTQEVLPMTDLSNSPTLGLAHRHLGDKLPGGRVAHGKTPCAGKIAGIGHEGGIGEAESGAVREIGHGQHLLSVLRMHRAGERISPEFLAGEEIFSPFLLQCGEEFSGCPAVPLALAGDTAHASQGGDVCQRREKALQERFRRSSLRERGL